MSDFDMMEAFHRQQISRRQFLRGALAWLPLDLRPALRVA